MRKGMRISMIYDEKTIKHSGFVQVTGQISDVKKPTGKVGFLTVPVLSWWLEPEEITLHLASVLYLKIQT
ncbi:hypothetical protein ETJ12_13095 [Salmonella enterica]|nr:hypothetical protein [Salmonella enterica]